MQLERVPTVLINSHLAASYYPAKFNDLELFLAYDKPWDEEFQDIPGHQDGEISFPLV